MTMRNIKAGKFVWLHSGLQIAERVQVSRVTKEAIFVASKSCRFDRFGREVGRRKNRWITTRK